jgi:hypothetical protein
MRLILILLAALALTAALLAFADGPSLVEIIDNPRL